MYDKNNIFAKIIRSEIPCSKIYEDDSVLAFKDIYPKFEIHILVIPKGEYIDFNDFMNKASDDEKLNFYDKLHYIANNFSKNCDFKILSNCGKVSGQEVFHFHMHILSGKKI